MSKLFFLLLFVVIQNLTVDGEEQPNIVVVVADDIGWNDVSYNGATDCVTPNLDSLSESGLQLNYFYVHPMCAPTRAALMTGRHPYRYGFQHEAATEHTIECGLNLTETLWSQVLQNNGYKTYMLGKWHLGFYQWDYTPNYRGFDEFAGYYGLQEGYWDYKFDNGTDFRNNTTPFNASTTGQYGPDLYADITEQWLQEIINDEINNQPFAMYIGHQVVHAPFDVSSEYVDNVKELMDYSSILRQNYCSMIYAMDNSIGELINTLKTSGLWNNTIFIFFSDNGPSAGVGSAWPLRGTKRTYFDGGIRVPAIISGGLLPNNRQGIIENESTSVIDIFATICEIANIDCTEYELDGISLYNYIQTGTTLNRDYLLLNVDSTSCTTSADLCGAIRSGDWKLAIGDQLIGGGEDDFYWNVSYISNSNIDYSQATIKCNGIVPSVGSYSDSDLLWDCGYLNQPCLFNVTNDPCEYTDLSNIYSNITNELMAQLRMHYDAQKDTLQNTCNYNISGSNPSNFDGFWSPWRTSPTGADGTNWQVTSSPTDSETNIPTASPDTGSSLASPTTYPSSHPSIAPTNSQLDTTTSNSPTSDPSSHPSSRPSSYPSSDPSSYPSSDPSSRPSSHPSSHPSSYPSNTPSTSLSNQPTTAPSTVPSNSPSSTQSAVSTALPTSYPSSYPSIDTSTNVPLIPSNTPSTSPTIIPTFGVSINPSTAPSNAPSSTVSTTGTSSHPSAYPSLYPSSYSSINASTNVSLTPSSAPSVVPTLAQSTAPSMAPSNVGSNVTTNFPSNVFLNQSSINQSSINPSMIPTLIPTTYPLTQFNLTTTKPTSASVEEDDDKMVSAEYIVVIISVIFILLLCMFCCVYYYKHRTPDQTGSSIALNVFHPTTKKKRDYNKLTHDETDDVNELNRDEKPLIQQTIDETDETDETTDINLEVGA